MFKIAGVVGKEVCLGNRGCDVSADRGEVLTFGRSDGTFRCAPRRRSAELAKALFELFESSLEDVLAAREVAARRVDTPREVGKFIIGLAIAAQL